MTNMKHETKKPFEYPIPPNHKVYCDGVEVKDLEEYSTSIITGVVSGEQYYWGKDGTFTNHGTSPKDLYLIEELKAETFPPDYRVSVGERIVAKDQALMLNKSTLTIDNPYQVIESEEDVFIIIDDDGLNHYFPHFNLSKYFRPSPAKTEGEKSLPPLIQHLADSLDKAGMKVTFGLTPKNKEVIEKHLAKFESAKYSYQVWQDIAGEIGWDALTAALWYFRESEPTPEKRAFVNVYQHPEGYRVMFTEFENEADALMNNEETPHMEYLETVEIIRTK